jgi:hypothetical protein
MEGDVWARHTYGRGSAPDERRWTIIAGIVLTFCLALGGVVTAALPIHSKLGDGALCGTAFIYDGPSSCEGKNTPYILISLGFFALAIAALVRVVMVARRHPRTH